MYLQKVNFVAYDISYETSNWNDCIIISPRVLNTYSFLYCVFSYPANVYSCLQFTTYFLFCYTSFVNLSKMATVYSPEHGDDNFVLELNREKYKVRTRFIELREILTETENKLMKALNDILSSYNSYKTEIKRMNKQKLEIVNIRNLHMTAVPTLPAVRTFHEKILQDLNEQQGITNSCETEVSVICL